MPFLPVVPRNIEEEVKESYLRYSLSVIISRALPDVRDGLKPSQRRILFAMRQLNLSPSAKHRKCAKICGDTSGDYHPHGEGVIYPTLVRMAQSWAMRYPLVDGQGNFGSIDGDPPAAMRYTEAKLTSSAVELMEDLERETVDMAPNYDETKVEPLVFPAKFPNLLCNGSSGIAVGMATNIPPHNLSELIDATLLLLDNKETSLAEIMKVMPGPDFPTGGEILGMQGIRDAYETGRGKLCVRALTHFEESEGPGSRDKIVIDEIPYGVNKAMLVEACANLVNEKTITGIADVRDESDKDGLRIVIELKKGENSEVVLNQLMSYTDLRVTFGCIFLALDKNLPKTMSVRQMILAWISHRIEVIRRRIRFELMKAEARAHILEGYLIATSHLDEVVKLIRESDNRDFAKQNLMSRFGLSEKQAVAVLDLRLYQLTGLEQEKIEAEHKELLAKIQYYKSVLADESLVRGIIREELLEVKKKHPSPRKTKILPAALGAQEMEDLIADEEVVITISADDYVKRMPSELFREQRRGGTGVTGFDIKRETDALKACYVAKTHDTLLLFTNLGRTYWLKVWQLPEGERRSKGKPLINLLEDLMPNEKVATILRTRDFDIPGVNILMTTKMGVVKKTELSAFQHQRKKGIRAIEIDEGDEVIAAHLTKEGDEVMIFTHCGMAVRFDENEVRVMGRTARGVKGVTLKDSSDYIVGCEVIPLENLNEASVLVVCENGFGKRTHVNEFRKTHRGTSGVRSIITSERNGLVVKALSVTDKDGLLLMSKEGQTIRIRMEELRVMGRSTQGVRLVNLKEEDQLLAVEKIQGENNEEESDGQPKTV